MPHKKILDEHIHLRILADRLRLIAAAPTKTLTHTRWRKLMHHELSALSDTLEQHFEGEERGGYMRNIVRAHPELLARADELLAQHSGMRDQLVSLITRVDDDAEIDALRPDLGLFLAALASHESNETELIQDALQRDTGTGD